MATGARGDKSTTFTLEVREAFPNQISSEPLTAELADDGRPAPVQPSIRATAAVCRRPLGRETDPNGQELTTLGPILAKKTS